MSLNGENIKRNAVYHLASSEIDLLLWLLLKVDILKGFPTLVVIITREAGWRENESQLSFHHQRLTTYLGRLHRDLLLSNYSMTSSFSNNRELS